MDERPTSIYMATMNNMKSIPPPRAYSYVRFSTPEQMRGDSFRRQVQAAERYALVNGLELDTKFAFHDIGVSAFRGRNRVDGMLGEFLSYVRSGDISKGSYLLVENLDRVSRENAWDAMHTLQNIAREGVTVVTMNDGRAYTAESLRNNFHDLLVALLMFSRANEESETKARRLREAWQEKRRKAADGRPMTSVCPAWLRLKSDRSGYEIVPERAEIVRRIFSMTLAGAGQHLVADTLNRESVAVFGRGKMWHRSYIKKLLENPAVIGRFTPHAVQRPDEGGKVRVPSSPIDNYFPAVVDRDTYDAVQGLGRGGAAIPREQSHGRSVPVHMLAGLATCPLCKASMTRVFKGRKGGKPYLVCTRAKGGAGCRYRQVKVEQIEEAITRNAGFIAAHVPSPDEQAQTNLESLRAAYGGVQDQIENLLQAIERTRDEGVSRTLVRRLHENEEALQEVTALLQKAEVKAAETLTNRVTNAASDLADSLEVYGPLNMPRIGALLRQLFAKVEVDFIDGQLRLFWRSADGQSLDVTYAWPEVAE